MSARRLALVVILYLGLDLTNPFVGAAFSFEDSAEGLATRHVRLQRQDGPALLPEPPTSPSALMARRLSARAPRARAERRVDLRRGHAAADPPPLSSEDH